MTINPKQRRIARERALQFLFGLDFTAYEWLAAIDAFWRENPSKPSVREYAETLIRGVFEYRVELDTAIDSALTGWTPERVARVERNILRVALYEIRHVAGMPTKVAINEAVEVAKRFGADDAPRFVNAVLDRLAIPANAES
ncbi:MAG: hypothetical protein AMXMBFR84_17450 [Candidatus Hydrogenedentota bacterium]